MTKENAQLTTKRRILQSFGSSVAIGMGAAFGSGTAAADESQGAHSDAEANRNIHIESLNAREKGQLRGKVFSSQAFKAIRRKARERGFKPQMGDVIGLRVENRGTDTTRQALKIPCQARPNHQYQGQKHDTSRDKNNNSQKRNGQNAAAVIYGILEDERIQAKLLSQYVGEPVYVDICVESQTGQTASKPNVTTLPLISAEEGE